MNFWDKLKREWKTFAWGCLSLVVECWDQILYAQLGLVDPMVDPNYQWIVHMVIPAGFFILRKWVDEHKGLA